MSANGYVDWGDIAPDGGTGNKIEYLRLRTGNKYKIRPVHRLVQFFKYFHRNEKGELKTAVCKDPKVIKSFASSHPDLQPPSSRYAIYVFDRTDGKLKVMEGPKTVFLPFRQRFEVTGKDPAGSTTGGDWLIDIQGTGKATKYTLTYIEDTPLTQDEIGEVDTVIGDEDGDKQLTNLYKPHSPEKIEERLFAEVSNDNSNSFETPTEQTTSEASSGDKSKKFNMGW